MRVNVNYEGLSADQVLKVAEILTFNALDSQKALTEINRSFPGRASMIEDAEPEPQIRVAIMFSVTEEHDLDEILGAINEYLVEIGLPGDAEWADLQQDPMEEVVLGIIENEANK